MTDPLIAMAVVLAATEILPDTGRDLVALLEATPNADLLAGRSHVNLASERDNALLKYLRVELDASRVEHWRARLTKLAQDRPGIQLILAGDSRYPRNLAAAYGRPPFIFVDGEVLASDARAVAIVGSRKASEAARSAAYDIAAAAAHHSITVVSGLAKGVDAAAHSGAIDAMGRTIAVVGVGIDREPDRESDRTVAPRIADHGATVSQFRPGSPATAGTFIARNAVISGLSCVSVIIDAGERSGTRSEADFALQQGRQVLLWEPLLGSQSWANVYALQKGVRMVSSVTEVLTNIESCGD